MFLDTSLVKHKKTPPYFILASVCCKNISEITLLYHQ